MLRQLDRRREVRTLGEVVRHPRDGAAGHLVAPVVALLLAAVWLAERAPGSSRTVFDLVGYRAVSSFPKNVIQLPLSVLAEAPHLPLWGAVTQVLFVLGIATYALGWRAALAIGLIAHVATSVIADVWIGAPSWLPLHLAAGDRYLLDTGPSAFTIALVFCVVWVLRLPALALVALAFLWWIGAFSGTFNGFEHGAAIILGLLAGWVWRTWARAKRRSGSGVEGAVGGAPGQ